MASIQQILKEIQEDSVEVVRFEMSDYYGIAHCKGIPTRHFREKAENGIPFFMGHLAFDPQAAIAPNTGYCEEVNFGDAIFYPDLTTFRKLPWAKDTARILLYPKYNGEIVKGYPRTIAERLLGELKEMGYSFYSSHEHEFFVVDAATKKPITNGIQIRSTIRLAKHSEFLMQIAKQMPKLDIDIESIETEYAPGQFEISYKPSFGLKAADNAFTYKNGIKEIAQGQGFLASFTTKPYSDQVGASAHLNHSLWDTVGNKNLMYDAKSPNSLSIVAQHWIAGILYHAPAITVLMSPTVNCLTRIRDHAFAPNNVTWGIDNRTTALRVKINGERGTYVENRIGSAGGCPYISLAATVAAGMDGIKNQYQLPPPVDGAAFDEANLPLKTGKLPCDMESALEALMDDQVIRNAFGEEFIKCFVALKTHEAKLQKEAAEKGIDETEWARSYYFDYL